MEKIEAMIGQVIAGRYHIERELGSGGMGMVFRGIDSQTEATVAIKHLRPELSQHELLERFKREGEALRELNHPNIVKLLDTVEHDGQYFLVMEYVAGGDLHELLKQGQLSVERCLKLALDLCDALTRAHKLDIIHRDLKPANVLLAEDGTLRLSDFGVALLEQQERITETGGVIGTLDYLAPEALDGASVDARSDIWAFGVLLYEMLAGERPFVGETISHLLRAILTASVPDLEAIRNDAPTALVDLIYRMLEKDPNARIRSVRQIGLELEDLLHGRSTATPPATRFETPVPETLVYQPPKHNLPTQTTAFVGRESELAELARLLEDPQVRLMTILAPGGMGKTRLSLEIARRVIGDIGQSEQSTPNTGFFSDGAFFVELAPLTNPEQIISTIATATGYQFQEDGRAQKQQILDFLQNKQTLLVMDNFEHLMGGARLVTEILNAAPQVQVLATSRLRLSQPGETLFHLGGMDFPDWETPEDALEYSAVKLFMNSARRAQPGWELTRDNLDYVARICRLVQGMPLAIVLAAAWLGLLSVEEVAEELQQGIDFLADETGEMPQRQQSIRLIFDYSWQMMNAAEQDVFMKLAVFQGGVTREAAQEVAGANLRVLMNLVNKALIRRDADNGRYEIHELLRQYALELLEASGEDNPTRDKHSDFYSRFLAGQESLLKGGGQLAAINSIEVEHGNCRQAWLWAVARKNSEVANRMIDGLHLYLSMRFRNDEGIELFQFARKQWPLSASDVTLLAGRLGSRFLSSNDPQELAKIFEQCLAFAQRFESPDETAFCQRELGVQIGHRSADDSEIVERGLEILESALQSYRELGNRFYAARVLDDMGWCYTRLGDDEMRMKLSKESIDIRREVGDVIGLGMAVTGYAIRLAMQNNDEGIQLIKDTYDIARRTNNHFNMALARQMLAVFLMQSGDLDQCWAYLKEAHALAKEVNYEMVMDVSQLVMARIMCIRGEDYDEAKRLIDSVLPNREKMFSAYEYIVNSAAAYMFYYSSVGDYESLEIMLKQIMQVNRSGDPNPFSLLVMPSIAMLLAYRGQKERAIEILGLVFTHKWKIGTTLDQWKALTEFRANMRNELGESVYDAAWERGKSSDLVTVNLELLDFLLKEDG